ncbi:MAG: MBL fold metallo-hydrolase [Candidatus Hydrogenedentes bacterium]|nr:MBL fold metallo-hydrolase [Candidatus Hydrogenedentota bacterium]
MNSSNSITLNVLGGGGEVGASCFHLVLDGYHVVLDSGTHPKKDGIEALPEFRLLHRAPDALLVSHAHVDHCGSVPYLVRQFPALRIHSTLPTVRIMDRMLHNSVSVMELLARERGILEYPLYSHDDVNYAMGGVRGHNFEETFPLVEGGPVEISFHHAGHVLGSASILLKAPGHTLFYTGDICETDQELMAGYSLLNNVHVDTLIIESTHGSTDNSHVRPYPQEALRLGHAIAEVLHQGGSVLIPSFALGRTQEMLNIVARLQEEGVIPEAPVFASGLGRAIYEIYNRFERYLHPDATLRPLDQFGRIGNVWERSVVRDLLAEPGIIIATSGMMLENTPSAMIAQEMVKRTHHGIFFVGYVDHETLGYRLLHSEPGELLEFSLGAPPVEVKLRNIQRFYFSAHAPRTSLRSVIERLHPKNVVFVHGDPPALAWMKEHTANGYRTHVPMVGQSVVLEA